MAPRKWDVYRSLNITSRDSNGMTCVGSNKYGKRCRWDIEGPSYRRIRALLDEIEGKRPSKAAGSLDDLAGLSLCEDYHQHQAQKMIDEWEIAIEEAEEEYEKKMGLRARIKELKEKLSEEEAKTKILGNALSSQKGRNLFEDFKQQQAMRGLQSTIGGLQSTIGGLQIQLVSKEQALALANKKCEENSTKTSLLEDKLSTMSSGYDYSLSASSPTIRIISAEREDFRAEAGTLMSKLDQLDRQSIETSQKLDNALKEKEKLLIQTKTLKQELNLASNKSRRYESELLEAKSHGNTLSKEVADLQLQLDFEHQRSSELALELGQAEIIRNTLSEEKAVIQSHLETEFRKNEELTLEASQLRTDQTTLTEAKAIIQSQLESKLKQYEELTAEVNKLNTNQIESSITIEELRTELASEQTTSAQLHHDLSTVTEQLSSIKLAVGETQLELESCRRSKLELGSVTDKRKEGFKDFVTMLNDRIEFLKTHPFSTFFSSVVGLLKWWGKGGIEWIWNLRSVKRGNGTNSPEVGCSA